VPHVDALKNLTEAERRRVLHRALELDARSMSLEQSAREAASLELAVRELGISDEHLAQALEQVQAEQRALAARRRWRAIAAAGVAAGALGMGGLWLAFAPSAPVPQTFAMNGAGEGWGLEKNVESAATLAFIPIEGRGEVAALRVESFGPHEENGKYRVNLDAPLQSPNLEGLETLSFAARGEGLTTLRVYLEDRDERWRSPAVQLSGAWTEHRLSLADFEHQTREGRSWDTSGRGAPASAQRLSFKVGHYMNEATARGEVLIDDVRLR
jgi:hypothetical protein